MLWLVNTLALLGVNTAAEHRLLGQIRGRVSIPGKFQQGLPAGGGLAAVKVIVDGGAFSALPTADGYFLLNGIPPGAHLLQVVHPTLRYETVRVEAQPKGGNLQMTAYLADLEHGRAAKLKYPLGLAPSEVYAYLEKREEFNIFSIFKSPMALISLFSFGAMFLLPKLQPMMEKEEERQRLESESRAQRKEE